MVEQLVEALAGSCVASGPQSTIEQANAVPGVLVSQVPSALHSSVESPLLPVYPVWHESTHEQPASRQVQSTSPFIRVIRGQTAGRHENAPFHWPSGPHVKVLEYPDGPNCGTRSVSQVAWHVSPKLRVAQVAEAPSSVKELGHCARVQVRAVV